MTENETCGYEDTTTGHPCQHPSGSCPVPSHSGDPIPNGGNPQGRPTKLTKGTQEGIAGMIEDGHSIAAAARSNGITVQTFFNWMERGAEQEQGIFQEFFERITHARGVGESNYIGAILDIARDNDDVSTLLTLVKSRYPESWADARRGEQTGAGVVVQLGEVDEYEIDPETLELIDIE